MRRGKHPVWDYDDDEPMELGFDGYEEERIASQPHHIAKVQLADSLDSPISPYLTSVFVGNRGGAAGTAKQLFEEVEMTDFSNAPLDLQVEEGEEDEKHDGEDAKRRPFGGLHWSLLSCFLCKAAYLPRTILLSGDPAQAKSSVKELKRRRETRGRGGVGVGVKEARNFPVNRICNQKYNLVTFLPLCLYEQFKYFCNLYFLVIALSQLIPQLQVGYLFTYIAPLAFVVLLSLAKEAVDDIKRYLRDRAANRAMYRRLVPNPDDPSQPLFVDVLASDIAPGHLIRIDKDERVPADVVVLRTTDETGGVFIRTDQLDGETDWKLRRAVAPTQALEGDEELFGLDAEVFAEKPSKEIYSFFGTFTVYDGRGLVPDQDVEMKVMAEGIEVEEEEEGRPVGEHVMPLTLENTMWSNTVLASGSVIGMVIYSGRETRSAMNITHPTSKTGILDEEVNTLAKVLCALLVLLAFVMVAIDLFRSVWWLNLFRFVVLFSAIIPISMRVNLDLAKLLYSYLMVNDENIEGTIVRNTAIPEELGRISYFLTDKTGTLTQNDMIFKKLHLGSLSFNHESVADISDLLREAYESDGESFSPGSMTKSKQRVMLLRKTGCSRVRDIISALALCHNVTPVVEVTEEGTEISYQASSPDEVALVKFTEEVGLTLVERTFDMITLRSPCFGLRAGGDLGDEQFEILECFPFTSERKRMGIIVRDVRTGEVLFLMKGADVVMRDIVEHNDWLDEECGNLAREGLRTLVFGKRVLSEAEYDQFVEDLRIASTALEEREEAVNSVIEGLEVGLELIGLTGVEDKLQEHVKGTLETLRNAGIKIWMLTGDKIETATCIAVSSKLVSRAHTIYQLVVDNEADARAKLEEFRQARESVLVIDGKSLQLCLDHMKEDFFQGTKHAPSVVCCRCSPTQKADVVNLIRKYTKLQTCAIGDGGNDVSMIQAANVGVGIEGKEGKQASLAADFSITQFSHVARLMLWHGRNSYQRSARLSQFIIHRGLIISFIQAIFSAIFYMATVAIYTGMLMVGYSTWYTMAPVFALVLDEDVTEEQVFLYPELYTELQKGRALSIKTFILWTLLSMYQASVIMVLSILLFEDNMINIVAITFTALILSELMNVSSEIQQWKLIIVLTEIITFALYFLSMLLLPTYFDLSFIATFTFWWKMIFVTLVSVMPPYLFKVIRRRINPPQWTKLAE